MIKWKKHGLLLKPNLKLWWMQSYAMLPTVDLISKNKWRVYFSGRCNNNKSRIGWAEFNVVRKQFTKISQEPVLDVGELGCFDDSGVTPSSIVNWRGKKYLYYIGWKMRSSVRFGLVAGLAISTDNGKSFKRASRAPMFQLTDQEPISILTAPYVLKEGNKWRVWYVSGIKWVNEDLPLYNIKYAESGDGMSWKRGGKVCIELKNNETALARPCVVKDGEKYVMWYAYKSGFYRMGYAESDNEGIDWKRKDNRVGVGVSGQGFDDQMLEYGYVVKSTKQWFMFYNGNEYGKDGIGLLVGSK
ncbi:hypothetical protein ACFL2V_06995 [Pseudomonadota bacterium]